MRRHIVVEGMDGSGKDTLIGQLTDRLQDYIVHPRASTSLGGPVAELYDWTMNNLASMDTRVVPPMSRWIFNRHPLISEPIYGPHRMMQPGTRKPFNDPLWLMEQRRVLARHAVVIICQPPWLYVRDNVESGQHMPGVLENAHTLYQSYAELVWPGASLRYNYVNDDPYTLCKLIRRLLEVPLNG